MGPADAGPFEARPDASSNSKLVSVYAMYEDSELDRPRHTFPVEVALQVGTGPEARFLLPDRDKPLTPRARIEWFCCLEEELEGREKRTQHRSRRPKALGPGE